MAMKAECCLEDYGYDFDDETQSLIDLYFDLRDTKEDCLLHLTDSGGTVIYGGELLYMDEELIVNVELNVMAEWLETIEGPDLVEYIF